jgi:CelD/BcsL family acetyltransferase involved in cellulose biosynthesis
LFLIRQSYGGYSVDDPLRSALRGSVAIRRKGHGMTVLDTIRDRASAPAAKALAGQTWQVDVSEDVTAISRAWLSLEMSGLATPYQTLGWQRAALSTLDANATPLLVTFRDRHGKTAGLLPLVKTRKTGVSIAMFPGGKHANYNMGLFAPGTAERLTAVDLQAVLASAAGQAGVDLFVFRNQPHIWAGITNPMARLPHQPAASSAWRADLMADADAFVASLMSSESRKKLRHKERKLAEIGPLAYVEASTPAEARDLLAAFLAQKKLRFAAMGITNPFDDPAALAFLEQAAAVPLEGGPPAPVALYALKTGDRVVAVFGGVIHGGRFCGMFTSFDAAPDVARSSPGDLLILHLVRTMCARGLTAFDLGVGDAAYKSDYCKIREELFDSFLPMTATGRLASIALSTAYRLKAGAARHKATLKPLRRLIGR